MKFYEHTHTQYNVFSNLYESVSFYKKKSTDKRVKKLHNYGK